MGGCGGTCRPEESGSDSRGWAALRGLGSRKLFGHRRVASQGFVYSSMYPSVEPAGVLTLSMPAQPDGFVAAIRSANR